MPSAQREAINQDLHPHAKALIRELVSEFATSLVLRSKLVSYGRQADLVLTNHVREANEALRSEPRKSWRAQLMIVIGGALFGAFIPGFIGELGSESPTVLSVFTIIGFVGMFLVFLGLRR